MIVNKERIVEKIHPVPIIDKQHSGIPTKKINNKELDDNSINIPSNLRCKIYTSNKKLIDSPVNMNILYTQAAAFNQLTLYTSIR